MVRHPLQDLAFSPDAPSVREYGSVLLLVFAATLLGLVVPAAVDLLGARLVPTVGARLVGTIVYAGTAFAALAAIYVAFRWHRDPSARLAVHERVQLGGTALALLLVASYVLHGAVPLPAVPEGVLAPVLTATLAMVAPAYYYADTVGTDLPVAIPDRDGWTVAGLAVLVAGLAGLAWTVVLVGLLDEGAGLGLLAGPFAPTLTAGTLVWHTVVPALAVGAGMAVLYTGAVQAAFRGRVGPAGAIGAVAALVGVRTWSPALVGSPTEPIWLVTTSGAVAVLALLGGVVAAVGTRFVTAAGDGTVAWAVAVAVGVVVAVFGPVGAVLVGPYPVSFVLASASLTTAAGVASAGYEASRSLWVPALAFAAYLLVVDYPVVAFIASYIP